MNILSGTVQYSTVQCSVVHQRLFPIRSYPIRAKKIRKKQDEFPLLEKDEETGLVRCRVCDCEDREYRLELKERCRG